MSDQAQAAVDSQTTPAGTDPADQPPDRLQSLLHLGEQVDVHEDVGESTVAVTSHRVVAVVPDGEPPVRTALRPNATGARVETTNATGHLGRATRAGVYGAVCLGGGWGLSATGLAAMLSPSSADLSSSATMGGLTGMLSMASAGIEALVTLLVAVGLALVLVAGAFAVLFVRSREATLVVDVPGAEDVTVPAVDPDRASATADALGSVLSE